MSTGYTLTEVQLPPASKESTGSKFLAKIARSPTSARRHKAASSQGSDIVPDTIRSPTSQTQGAANSRKNQVIRPGFHRQVSAPDTVARLNTVESTSKHHSDASGETALQAKAMLQRQPTIPAQQPSSNSFPLKGANMSFAPLVSEYYIPSGQNAAQSAQGQINYMYQQMYELSQKRIATLQYMRRAHEGSTFWFNTAHFSKGDISRLPTYTPSRLTRRAMNSFLLGISIPAVLDIHQIPRPGSEAKEYQAAGVEYLKSLNNLLAEYDNYQERHPQDGSHPGSLSRARLPNMFKRSGTTNRPRKSSTAISQEIGTQISPPAVPDTPHHQLQHSTHPSLDTTSTAVNPSFLSTTSNAPTLVSQPSFNSVMPTISHTHTIDFSATATFPPPGPADAPNSSLLVNETPYSFLLTPPLPFAPDFYTVFATLCDVLIDTYQKLLQIINSPTTCTATVSELFNKTDAKIRKIMVAGIVRDFEAAARENAKKELAGVQKVVLGGLMG